MHLVNKVVPLAELEAEGVTWAREILQMSPTAIRFLKSSFLVATDGLAGLQEFAGTRDRAVLHDRRGARGIPRVPREAPDRVPQVPAPPVTRPAPTSASRARGPTLGAAHLGAGCPAGNVARRAERRGRGDRGRARGRRLAPARHRAGLRCRRPPAAGPGQLRQRSVRLPARGRHSGPLRPDAGRGGRVGDGATARGRHRADDRDRRHRRAVAGVRGRAGPAGARGARRRRGARLHGRPVAIRLPRPWARCSCSSSSAWWRSSAPRTSRCCAWSRCSSWPRIPAGALITAILVVNNLRDIPTDRAAGKRTLAVILGAPATRVEYALLLAVSFAVPSAWSSPDDPHGSCCPLPRCR